MMKLQFIILAFILYACLEKQDHGQDIVMQTVGVALDSITFGALDSATLNHVEKYPNRIKKVTLDRFIKDATNLSGSQIALLKTLSNKIQDSVTIVFQDYRFKHNLIIEDDFQTIEYDSSYFGSINMSNPVIDLEEEIGYYYLALNCFKYNVDGCSVGYLIYVGKENGKWRVLRTYQLWVGEMMKPLN
ncbi:MAG: hypothetical protein ACK5PC_00390 [Cyclobacteriaceae bacterium]|jgi:hypothetical protein|nr:hypothetical protein [Flammeovirgaceae bacterium]